MLGNTTQRWGSASKVLHWLLVLMICVEVPVGFLMALTYAPSLKYSDIVGLHDVLAQIHHTTGFFVLLLFAIRLLWRLRHDVPRLPDDFGGLRRGVARVNHWILYALLFLVPLSGWAALSVLADTPQFGETHIWFFGSDSVPGILPPVALDHPYGYAFFARIHRYLLIFGGVVLAGHVLAALWHHWIRKDGLLLRMWPGTGP